tara:strand:- start:346 stop:747 length:402 start_codon:yes stop_codon:yes gene_type:complete
MALPGSGQISINDIATEFGVTLANVALNATLATYAGIGARATTAMSDFYGLSSLTEFSAGTTSFEEPEEACGEEAFTTRYHNGSGSVPVAGDNVYTDSGGTSALSNGCYKIQVSNTVMIIESGAVSEIFNECE